MGSIISFRTKFSRGALVYQDGFRVQFSRGARLSPEWDLISQHIGNGPSAARKNETVETGINYDGSASNFPTCDDRISSESSASPASRAQTSLNRKGSYGAGSIAVDSSSIKSASN